ncbi:MAG TPA: hypothetical protein VK886_16985 [Vicinamibacterales bacterium]|nr:hypothetical protein [Vicinamibacterales bacterium]
MPREAKLFEVSRGLPSRAFRKGVANVPPAWIKRARASRKNREPAVVRAMKKLYKLRVTRPHATATIKTAERELIAALKSWEIAYEKEMFYNGVRVLMELQRDGASNR